MGDGVERRARNGSQRSLLAVVCPFGCSSECPWDVYPVVPCRGAAWRVCPPPWSLSSLRAATAPFARPRRGVGDVLRKRGS